MTTPVREWMQQEVAEGGSCLITFTLEDETNAPIPLLGVGTLRLWLYDESTEAPLGGRTNQDIKNVNGGTVGAADGKVTLALGPADNPILDATKRSEWHCAQVKCSYNGGAGVVEKVILFRIVNLSFVP